MTSTLPDVLAAVRSIVRTLPGLNPANQPTEQDENQFITLVYSREGRTQLATSHGDGGYPRSWQFDVITVEVVTVRSDLESDFDAIEPYTHLIPNALIAAFSNDKWNGRIQVLGDAGTPGSTWPVRRSLILEDRNEMPVIGYQFEVDVSYQVDIIHD